MGTEMPRRKFLRLSSESGPSQGLQLCDLRTASVDTSVDDATLAMAWHGCTRRRTHATGTAGQIAK